MLLGAANVWENLFGGNEATITYKNISRSRGTDELIPYDIYAVIKIKIMIHLLFFSSSFVDFIKVYVTEKLFVLACMTCTCVCISKHLLSYMYK